jgi:hypothetical protein
MLKTILLLVIVLFYPCIIKAEQGCYVGNKIYFNQTGTVSFFGMGARYLYEPNMFYEDDISGCTGVSAMAHRSNMATQGIFGSTIQCGFTGDSYYTAGRGYVWNFNVVVCSIDGCIIFILLAIAGCGFCALRKVAECVPLK